MSTRNTIVTSVLTALITSICTFFVLDYVKRTKNKPKEAIVPQVVGLKPSQAMEVLDGRKLRLQIIERRADPTVPTGQICSQHPLPDSKVLEHSAINVVLSSGPPQVTVPTCKGIKLQDFTVLLTKQKLKLGAVSYEKTDKVQPNQILSCTPKSGTVTRPGTVIKLTVAKKPDDEKEVPKVKGMSCSHAKKAIEAAGFKVGKVKWRMFDAPPYLCMRQDPDPKTKAKPGSEINITCSKDD